MDAHRSLSRRHPQGGLTTVEFAVVGALFFTLMFGVLEVGRALFVWNALTEATRRGARVAAVCPVNDPAIRRIAVFNGPAQAGVSPVVAGLAPTNVQLAYLDEDGVVVGDPAGDFTDIRYVRTRITNFQLQLAIPFVSTLLDAPPFETVIPRESLGVPRDGAIAAC